MATEQEVLAGLIQNANEQIDRANTAKRMANDWAEQKKLALPFQDVGTERSAAGGVFVVKPDQFHDYRTPSAAARAYLELRGKVLGAASPEDILGTLKRGGFAFGKGSDDDHLLRLRIALRKDRSFKRIANGYIGLREWYRKGGDDDDEAPAKKAAPKAAKSDKPAKIAKTSEKPAKTSKTEKKTPPAPTNAAPEGQVKAA
jgi:hypothetical protein